MFAYLKGTLAAVNTTTAILDVSGIGYSLFIPVRLLGELPPIGSPAQLFTTFIVRENSQALYGFISSHERDVFEILLNITGVGLKLALSLIGHLTLDDLQSAIAYQDLPTLCRVPGVGKKTAERLMVELKDKLPNFSQIQSQISYTIPLSPSSMHRSQDAILALVNLGYHQSIAQKAIKQTMQDLPEDADLALIITTALKKVR